MVEIDFRRPLARDCLKSIFTGIGFFLCFARRCRIDTVGHLFARGVTAHHVSLSDEGDLVLAFVVLEQSGFSLPPA